MSTGTVRIDDRQITAIVDALRNNNRGGSSIGGDSSSGSLNPIRNLGSVVSSVTPTFGALRDIISNNIDVWRRLSGVGANFSNDILGMTVAAAGARVSLEQFAGILEENAKTFAALGGSVSRGVEAFARFSREFQDSDISRQMMQLGYTTVETNELLALQIGFMRTKFSADRAMQDEQFEKVRNLANEMDLLAKLTGQSRKEQAEALKKARDDAALEARFRLIGLQQGADAEKIARENFAQQFMQAEVRGQGQIFKDIFIRGAISSQEAAMQMAIGGQAAIETAHSAQALAQGNYELADQFNREAQATMAYMANTNQAFLEIVTRTGTEIGGPISNVAGELFKANEALSDSVQAIIRSTGELADSQERYREIIERINEDLRRSQAGISSTGEQVSQATEAIIDSEKLIRDIRSGVAEGLELAFRDQIAEIATGISNAVRELQGSSDGVQFYQNIGPEISRNVDLGIRSLGEEGGPIGTAAYMSSEAANFISEAISPLAESFGSTLRRIFTDGQAEVNIRNFQDSPVPSRIEVEVPYNEPLPVVVHGVRGAAIGGPVGLNGPELVLTGEEGPEYVLNDDLANRFIHQTIRNLPTPRVDIDELSQSISQSFNSISGNSRRPLTHDSRASTPINFSREVENQLSRVSAQFEEFSINIQQEFENIGNTAGQNIEILKDVITTSGIDTRLIPQLEELKTYLENTNIDKFLQDNLEGTNALLNENFDFDRILLDKIENLRSSLKNSDIDESLLDQIENLRLHLKNSNLYEPFREKIEELTSPLRNLNLDEVFQTSLTDSEHFIRNFSNNMVNENENYFLNINDQLRNFFNTNSSYLKDTFNLDKEIDAIESEFFKLAEFTINQQERTLQGIDLSQLEDKEEKEISTNNTFELPNLKEMIKDIAQGSGINDIDRIQIGQKIKLPDGTDYDVKQGDTLSQIAQDAIKNLNDRIVFPVESMQSQLKISAQEADQFKERESRQPRVLSDETETERQKAPQNNINLGYSTLDDVVKKLDMLNTTMNKMILVSETLGRQQLRAHKNSNSSNLYERYVP